MKKTVKFYEVTTNSSRYQVNEGFYLDRDKAIYAAAQAASYAADGVKYTLKVYTLPLPLPAPYSSVKELLHDYDADNLVFNSEADLYTYTFIEAAPAEVIDFNRSVAIRSGLERAKALKARS